MAGVSSITVSGPPSTIKLFFEISPGLLHARRHPLPLTAAYHASHLDVCNVEEIIGTSPILDRPLLPNVSIVSSSSGQFIGENCEIREVLYRAMNEILQLPINWPPILDNLTTFSINKDITLSVIGPINTTGYVERALRPISLCNMAGAALGDEESNSSEHRPACEAIAIVGMSGRFPKAESLDEFWQVLVDGLDLHKEV